MCLKKVGDFAICRESWRLAHIRAYLFEKEIMKTKMEPPHIWHGTPWNLSGIPYKNGLWVLSFCFFPLLCFSSGMSRRLIFFRSFSPLPSAEGPPPVFFRAVGFLPSVCLRRTTSGAAKKDTLRDGYNTVLKRLVRGASILKPLTYLG